MQPRVAWILGMPSLPPLIVAKYIILAKYIVIAKISMERGRFVQNAPSFCVILRPEGVETFETQDICCIFIKSQRDIARVLGSRYQSIFPTFFSFRTRRYLSLRYALIKFRRVARTRRGPCARARAARRGRSRRPSEIIIGP